MSTPPPRPVVLPPATGQPVLGPMPPSALPTLGWQLVHTWAIVRSTCVGAAAVWVMSSLAFVEAQPTATLGAAIGSRAAILGLLAGAIVAGLQGVANLYKPSPSTPVLPGRAS